MAMRSHSHRRRRRRRSSSTRVVTRPVVSRRQQFQLRSAETLATVGVAIATATLVALVWIIASRAIESQRNDARAQVESTLTGQALVLADQVRHEILEVEQSLRILKQAFQADPDHFDMRAWREQMPALADVTDDAFIADSQLVIQHDINPQEVGFGIGSRASGMFGSTTEKLDKEDSLTIGPIVEKLRTRQNLSLLLMRLDRPGGWLVGATYHTTALTRVFAEAGLGVQGMTALVDTDQDRVQAVTGPAAATNDSSIASTAMYAAMKVRPEGTWIGPSALDGVQRIHAFRPIAGRKLAVVVAASEANALKPAAALAEGARSVAAGATLVILAAAGLALYVIWTYRSKRRLRQNLEREQVLVANLLVEATELRTRLEARGGQLQALYNSVSEGVLLLDPDLRLSEWNQAFAGLFGVAPETLQPGLPIDELLRVQARGRAFGNVDDIEEEVAQRLVQLRSASGLLLYGGPNGRTLALMASRQTDKSLLLVVREATAADTAAPEAAPLEAPAVGPLETL